jgi:hypothetical protein
LKKLNIYQVNYILNNYRFIAFGFRIGLRTTVSNEYLKSKLDQNIDIKKLVIIRFENDYVEFDNG